ncbi:MAG: mechanosensitive ion channel family protein [Saprospiraceae bacterium]
MKFNLGDMWTQFNKSFNNLQEKLAGWVNEIIVAIPNIILAVLVITIGIFLSRFIKKYVTRGLKRFSGQHAAINDIIANVVTGVFLLIVLFIVLGILNLSTALTSLLAGAGVVGLAVGLALQDPLINLFSGIMMSVRGGYQIGDLVETNGFLGTIRHISLRSTRLETPLGEEIIIPNRLIVQSPIKNYTSTRQRKVALSSGVSYGDDLDKVNKIAVEAIREHVDYDKKRPIDFYYTEFGDSSINFTIRFWLSDSRQSDFLVARSSAIVALKNAFDQQDISIPFPIRTLDFGIKGGESLAKTIQFDSSKNGKKVLN